MPFKPRPEFSPSATTQGAFSRRQAPCYGLRPPQAGSSTNKNKTNNPEEWESTEHLGLDSAATRRTIAWPIEPAPMTTITFVMSILIPSFSLNFFAAWKV